MKPLMIATAFFLMAAGNDCVITDYRANVPGWMNLPPASELPGVVLPIVSGDPTAWELPIGPWSRTAPACDPDGDAYTVELVSASLPVTITQDFAAGTWTLSANIPQRPRKHLIIVRATDEWGGSQDFILPVARTNRPPVLK